MSSGYLLMILYTLGLFAFLFTALFAAVYQIRKKQNSQSAVLIILGAIAIDLIIFHISIDKNVILESKKVKFDEKNSAYHFPKKRTLNLLSEDVFHNFRPALYKKHAALGSYTVTKKLLNTDSMSRVYVALQGFNQKYPLYNELNNLSIKEFVEYGFSNIDKLSMEEKVFFVLILRAVSEGFGVTKESYAPYIDIGRVVANLIEDLGKNELLVGNADSNTGKKYYTDKIIIALFNLFQNQLFDYESRDYLILDKKENLSEKRKFYNFLYNDISAREYLAFLFEKNISDEHIFVLLKDYYELINSDKTYKYLRGYNNLLNGNLLRVMGATDDMIKYYPSARFLDKKNIISSLGNRHSNEDILYLEGKKISEKISSINIPPLFSYQVIDYNPNILGLEYQASRDGYLYLSDCFDTYWNASIDGKRTTLYKANVAFKAVKIPAGKHKVSFVYDPKYFRYSLWFYYIGFILIGFYLVLGAAVNIRKN